MIQAKGNALSVFVVGLGSNRNHERRMLDATQKTTDTIWNVGKKDTC